MHRGVNLGVAVDLDYQGLVVPVVRGADGMRLRGLAAAVRDVAARARAKKLGPDELAGGTFTITNPGAAGTWVSFPVLNAPQVGILSTDGVAKRVVADDRGGLRIAPVGNLCLTFDHRALDGAYAGAFLRRVRARSSSNATGPRSSDCRGALCAFSRACVSAPAITERQRQRQTTLAKGCVRLVGARAVRRRVCGACFGCDSQRPRDDLRYSKFFFVCRGFQGFTVSPSL